MELPLSRSLDILLRRTIYETKNYYRGNAAYAATLR